MFVERFFPIHLIRFGHSVAATQRFAHSVAASQPSIFQKQLLVDTQIIRILEKKFNKKRPFARFLAFITIVGPTSPKSQVKRK